MKATRGRPKGGPADSVKPPRPTISGMDTLGALPVGGTKDGVKDGVARKNRQPQGTVKHHALGFNGKTEKGAHHGVGGLHKRS